MDYTQPLLRILFVMASAVEARAPSIAAATSDVSRNVPSSVSEKARMWIVIDIHARLLTTSFY